MDVSTWGTIAGIAGFCVALASGIAKLIARPTELRLTALETERKEAEIALMTARKEIEMQLADIRDRYVKQSEMNGHIAHLDKSLDEAKRDIRDIRDLMQDFIKGIANK